MEELLKQLFDTMKDIKENVIHIDESVKNLEQRLSRLEKMDSIEHRVSVNQIDLSDIKEIVEKVEQFQREQLLPITKKMNCFPGGKELEQINKRLDAQLTKIAQNEEAILIINGKKKHC